MKRQAGDDAGALAASQESLDIARKLAAQDHANARAQRDLFVALIKVALARLRGSDRDGALALFQEALEIAAAALRFGIKR